MKRKQKENNSDMVEHHNGSFETYMSNKISKLDKYNQLLDNNDIKSNIFANCRVFINGYVEPSINELKLMIMTNGGQFYGYQLSDTTHFVCNVFTESQIRQFRTNSKQAPLAKLKYVTVNWIVDSIKRGHRLNECDYLPSQLIDYNTNKINKFFSSKHDTSPNKQSSKSVNDIASENNANSIEIVNSLIDNKSPNKLNVTNNSETNPEFLNQYFNRSRLHFIGVWRNRLADLIGTMNQSTSRSSATVKNNGYRLVIHIDMDCFFVSALVRNDPILREGSIPIGVAHSSNGGSSEISSCNYAARAKGVRNGMFMSTVKKLCPDIRILAYDFKLYEEISVQVYKILYSHDPTAIVEPVSVDEAYIEYRHPIDGYSKAKSLREQIYKETYCQASAGIGRNILLAKLATKKAKPNGQLVVNDSEDHILEFMKSVKVSDLPGIGYRNLEKLSEKNLNTCEDIWLIPIQTLKNWFGPALGSQLYNTSRGIDDTQLKPLQPRQSIGAEVNWGLRFTDLQNADIFLSKLSEELSNRLTQAKRKGYRLTVKIKRRAIDGPIEPTKFLGHGICDNISESISLQRAIYQSNAIRENSLTLFHNLISTKRIVVNDLRGMGLQMSKLVNISDSEINSINDNAISNCSNNDDGIEQSNSQSVNYNDIDDRYNITTYDNDSDSDYNSDSTNNPTNNCDNSSIYKQSAKPTISQEYTKSHLSIDLSSSMTQPSPIDLTDSSEKIALTSYQQEFLSNLPKDIRNEVINSISNQVKPLLDPVEEDVITLIDEDEIDEDSETLDDNYKTVIKYMMNRWDDECSLISKKCILLYIQLVSKSIDPLNFNLLDPLRPPEPPASHIIDQIFTFLKKLIEGKQFDRLVTIYDNMNHVINQLSDHKTNWLNLINELKNRVNNRCIKLYSAKLL